jgi:hypothetical protein
MQPVCATVRLTDLEGKSVLGVMIAHAPSVDGIVDTSSVTLSTPFLLYDNCKGTGYLRQLGVEDLHVVRTSVTGVTGEAFALSDGYARRRLSL